MSKRSRLVETRWAMGRPLCACLCSHNPPSIAKIIPSRLSANSRYGRSSRGLSLLIDALVTREGPLRNQLQVILPSSVEGAIAAAVPKNTVHVSAPSEECVAEADHPPAVASGTEIVTPAEEM